MVSLWSMSADIWAARNAALLGMTSRRRHLDTEPRKGGTALQGYSKPPRPEPSVATKTQDVHERSCGQHGRLIDADKTMEALDMPDNILSA